MNTVKLIIKERYLEEIICGLKKVETRDIWPGNAKKYIIEIGESDIEPRKYDTITFFAGYRKDRKTAVVEIKSAEIFILTDEENNAFEFEHRGEIYVESIIEYSLGEILSHNFANISTKGNFI